MKNLLAALLLTFPLFTYAADDNKEKDTTSVTTSFQGTIDDVTNYKPVGDVKLTLISADNKLQKVIKTNKQGQFLVDIPAGAYTVKFEKDGYETGKYQNLVISEGRSNNFGFVLFRD